MTRPWSIALGAAVIAGCGFVPTATDPEAMLGELAGSLSTDDCVAGALRFGDKDGDRRLTRREFVDLTLIALDGMASSVRRQVDDLADRRRRRPGTLSAEEHAARAATFEAQLANIAKERTKGVVAAEARFERFDADRDGMVAERELADACRILAAEDRAKPEPAGM